MNKLQWIVSRLKEGSLLLDIGCGEGTLKGTLRKIGVAKDMKIYGVDVRLPAVERFYQFHRLDLSKEKLPFSDNFFDCVIIHHVLEHLPNPVEVIEDTCRVLKVGGILYVETPSTRSLYLPSLRPSANDDSPINFFDDPSHLRPYNKCSLSRLCKGVGLTIESMGLHPDYARSLMSPIYIIHGLITLNRGKIARGLRSLLGWNIYTIAVKRQLSV
ncbi:MAG: class I SAM-dependent methyltransferase [Thermodesulfovibrionia bacterium]|nr:class I SAM-dependent methyltransferase [Thermodesulfovibrionia bacterium]